MPHDFSALDRHQVGNRPKISDLIRTGRAYRWVFEECVHCGSDRGKALIFTDNGEYVNGQDGQPWRACCKPCGIEIEHGRPPFRRPEEPQNPYLNQYEGRGGNVLFVVP